MDNAMRAITVAVLGLGFLTACSEDNVKPAYSDRSVQAVYQSANCGRDQASSQATWIDSHDQLKAAYKRARSARLGVSTAPPYVNFDTHGVLLIELGQRPTAGYLLRLASQRMVMDKGDGLITFSIDKPAGVAAQVITSPCLFVAAPRGDYRGVRALSTDNTVSLQTAVP